MTGLAAHSPRARGIEIGGMEDEMSSWKVDPAKGIFETLRVQNGVALDAEAHLKRLNASLESVFGQSISTAEFETCTKRAVQPVDANGRLRTIVKPGSDRSLQLECTFDELDIPMAGSPLKPLQATSALIEGGFGHHKWVHRPIETSGGDAIVLLHDRSDSILEFDWATFFVVKAGRVITPPLDGSRLPGITRMRLLTLLPEAGIETEEGSIHLSDLPECSEIFSASSVQGVRPVVLLDHKLTWPIGETTTRASELLFVFWDGLVRGPEFLK